MMLTITADSEHRLYNTEQPMATSIEYTCVQFRHDPADLKLDLGPTRHGRRHP